ncbi:MULTISPECIES: porin [Vitreoscilla]|uniref:Porin n=1 Tax=Vitreoscilla stercoraria TaxID=61 RepID=A0ABY4EDL9_VITST|nr:MULTISPECIES: porin [Vitreoscilla]QJQ52292.1 putative porin [Vitreoscilla sp. C1]UOO93319.1 porin [Vitreoscilla stercoraria]
MKKILIASAVLMAAPAMADVVLYGQIKGGVGYTKGEGSGSLTQMEDYKSRIGFKGTEDLGNGMQAFWQVEQFTPISGAEQSMGWNNRDTFVGVKGDFGAVRAGYISDVMNEAGEHKLLLDPWETGFNADNPRGNGAFVRIDKRWQGVRYDSPDFGGFKFNVQHQLADSATEGNLTAASTVRQATIVSGKYVNSGFEVHGAYGQYKQQNIDGNGDLDDGQIARVIGAYRANGVVASLAYQYTDGFRGLWAKNSFATTAQDPQARIHNPVETHEVLGLFSYNMGSITPRISYSHGFDEKHKNGGKVSNSGYDQVIVGADYALSKRTTALASFGWKNAPVGYKVDANGKVSGDDRDSYSAGVGLRHVF